MIHVIVFLFVGERFRVLCMFMSMTSMKAGSSWIATPQFRYMRSCRRRTESCETGQPKRTWVKSQRCWPQWMQFLGMILSFIKDSNAMNDDVFILSNFCFPVFVKLKLMTCAAPLTILAREMCMPLLWNLETLVLCLLFQFVRNGRVTVFLMPWIDIVAVLKDI